ncbi:uncharacterized protein LOC128558323 [Mercenaria mercenaria]|uniref:uncharacterized protein LOC128558323 n=1 Tax=Mercenaria mercenaria TaxID=6596 RepID=UPI00234EA0FF|nr:uncharacterized protein LOC128558323 [Mercenaria mercenaria]
MSRSGAEEKRLAIERGDFSDGVPAITVICDGGWSKRSHKPTYNALGGVGVIFGAVTKTILYIGVRNKDCSICCRAKNKGTDPKEHTCFKNWSDSSQSMESDIILTGFLEAESVHGVRYTKIIADGDSSVYAKLQENVPVWGRNIVKLECANHTCKCLRSNLEKLVTEKPQHKGKGKLTKLNRIFENQYQFWKLPFEQEMEASRRPVKNICTKEELKELIKDTQILLNRIADKSDRLIGNFTTNLCESWMSIRSKFDGGKFVNRCGRGSWNARCYGGGLRKNLGIALSPLTFHKVTQMQPGQNFYQGVRRQSQKRQSSVKYNKKPESKTLRRKRKFQDLKVSQSKRAKIDYGSNLDDTPDISQV